MTINTSQYGILTTAERSDGFGEFCNCTAGELNPKLFLSCVKNWVSILAGAMLETTKKFPLCVETSQSSATKVLAPHHRVAIQIARMSSDSPSPVHLRMRRMREGGSMVALYRVNDECRWMLGATRFFSDHQPLTTIHYSPRPVVQKSPGV